MVVGTLFKYVTGVLSAMKYTHDIMYGKYLTSLLARQILRVVVVVGGCVCVCVCGGGGSIKFLNAIFMWTKPLSRQHFV